MKVNLEARIKRHSRILKDWIIAKWSKQIAADYSNKIMLWIIIFVIPVYPTLASIFHNNTVYDFYRWDIDESSIIWSYFWDDELDDDSPYVEVSEDSFLSINTILNDVRDLSWTNDISEYIIKPWDNISKIAYRFRVSNNSIYWANNLSKNDILRPGDILKIPPVSWLIHQVAKGDTLASIAKKYDVEEEKIKKQNLFSDGDTLIAWEVLVIPWAIKKAPPPIYKTPPSKYLPKNYQTTTYAFASKSSSQYVNPTWTYDLVWRKPQHTFYWWNCTWYVAQYKNVNWWWNANQWIKNATAKWHAIWSTPVLWAIVQLEWRWYNPKYGHVAIVMDIKPNHIIVSDMNYRRLWEVTYRRIPINDRAITWYIYVD